MLPGVELERYNRQILINEIGPAGQEKLKNQARRYIMEER